LMARLAIEHEKTESMSIGSGRERGRSYG